MIKEFITNNDIISLIEVDTNFISVTECEITGKVMKCYEVLFFDIDGNQLNIMVGVDLISELKEMLPIYSAEDTDIEE